MLQTLWAINHEQVTNNRKYEETLLVYLHMVCVLNTGCVPEYWSVGPCLVVPTSVSSGSAVTGISVESAPTLTSWPPLLLTEPSLSLDPPSPPSVAPSPESSWLAQPVPIINGDGYKSLTDA